MFVGTIIAATLLGILTYLAINAFTKKGGREAEPPQPPPEDNKKEKTKEGTYKGRI
jgi:hypothetical protein